MPLQTITRSAHEYAHVLSYMHHGMQKYPRTDLRASNNIVHLRTCADSCHTLGEFINYYANDGDLVEESDAANYLEKNKVSVCFQGKKLALANGR